MELEYDGAEPSVAPSRPGGPGSGDTGIASKKKPVRRDPEKRRLQNIQAQKKYSECSSPCVSRDNASAVL